jgi:hypothetical protein
MSLKVGTYCGMSIIANCRRVNVKLSDWYLQPSAQKWRVPSNAYHLTGIFRCAQVRETPGQSGPQETIQVWDGSSDMIVFGSSPDEAQRLFEAGLLDQPKDERPRQVTIRKISLAPVVGQLLTESGTAPLNWPKILVKADAGTESGPGEDFEQGYWVDVDKTVRADKLSFSIGTLPSDVPDEVRSGLNWSGEKQFFFLLEVLPLAAPPAPPVFEMEGVESEPSDEPSTEEIEVMNVTLPETVAVIQARNSVVAAWLWRRYAANTQWNGQMIQITPLCGAMGEP